MFGINTRPEPLAIENTARLTLCAVGSEGSNQRANLEPLASCIGVRARHRLCASRRGQWVYEGNTATHRFSVAAPDLTAHPWHVGSKVT